MDDTDDIIQVDQPKIVRYGPDISRRFTKENSPLHRQQIEALESLGRWFSEDTTKNSTAVVVMPTGTGKSGVICCLPYYLGAKIPSIKNPFLVIAPGLTILHQLKVELLTDPFLMRLNFIKSKEKGLGYAVFPTLTTTDVAKLEVCAPAYDIVLTNAQKWRKKVRHDPESSNYADLPENLFSVIIVDEAHHLPANQWKEIIEKFKKYAKVVFFTATPNRADGNPITEDLKEVGYAYQLSRDEAIDQKLIRDVEMTILRNAAGEIQNGEGLSEIMCFAKAIVIEIKNCMEAKNEVSLLPGGKKHSALIITSTIKEAKEVKKICIESGFSSKLVEVVHSEKSGKEKIIQNIKQCKYEVVIIVSMLLEGFDHPPFSIAGIVTKIRSSVKFAQFVGRVQRVVREGGKKEANIKADVISHEYFEQKKLFDEYKNPVIKDEEDESLDDDCPR